MKFSKSTLLLSAVICTAFVITACSSPQNKDETTGQVETTQESIETDPAVTQESEDEFQILTAKVTAVSETFADVTVKDGSNELNFSLENADNETTYEITPNTEITLVYRGNVKGTDTSTATVLMVLDAQKDAKIQYAEGSVIEQAMSTFSIQTEDGTEVRFLKTNAEGLDMGVLGQASDENNGSGVNVKVTYIGVSYDNGVSGGEANITNMPLKVERIE